MFERFTDRARKVMQLANQEAQRLRHEYIGTEHILLGLVKEGSGVASNVLRNLDVDLRKIRMEVEKIVQSGPDMVLMGKMPQTPRAKKVIEYAIEESRKLNHNYVGTEHLLLGLIREEEGVAAQVLMNLGLRMEAIRNEVHKVLAQAGRDTASTGIEQPRHLDSVGRDLTALARQGKLDPLIGRPAQLQALVEVLGCRWRNSAVLVGETGVGKTALVAGLAQAIAARLAPNWLDGYQVVELSPSRLWTNTRAESDFDQALRAILNEVRRSGNVILFIPEGLRLLATPLSVPALHVLHAEWLQALPKSELRCILTGTPADYQACTSRQVPLERCCQSITVPAMTVEETLEVLRGLRDRYEEHHGVRFSEDALASIVGFADHDLPGALPGKALLLLDRAGACGRRKGAAPAHEIRQAIVRLEAEIEQIIRDKESAVAEQTFDQAAELREKALQLATQREQLLLEEKRRRREPAVLIAVADVAEALRDLIGDTPPLDGPSHVTAITRPGS
jgi:ATP-dependent Clp protease ATP-binding subunit ClpC